MADVIAVHPGHQWRAAPLEPGVEGRHQATGRLVQHANSRIAVRPRIEHLARPVHRTVIDRHHLEIVQGLAVEAGDAVLEEEPLVADGKEDGNGGDAHRAAKDRRRWSYEF